MSGKLSAIIGVDPGNKGAYCLLIPTTMEVAFHPTTEKPQNTYDWLKEIQVHYNLRVVMVEKVHAIPGSAAGASFSFGGNFDRVQTIPLVAGAMVDLVTPKTWQKHVGLSLPQGLKGSIRKKRIKTEVAAICERLYPHVNIRGPKGGLLDGLSDSLLIAHYAAQTHTLQ